ncbi:hypothetical protein MKK58_17625 [Methylobacterium sp. J-078]|uniref:hypothetical protein n=1 Tax=Methylobacterium sp. J-078 TaxID=2836657 RepID=UPI001FBAE463|nr:hypothetical protein [Methylobacterium sp. J-078]MCJ2046338.1 hypothetical protein [Methylobacterium sp. J-078]
MSLPPGLYCEDEATYALLLADPAYETARVPAGAPSPMLHGLQVWIATPAQAAILRAMPAGTGATQPAPDWKDVRARAERFLLEFCQPRAWDPPPVRSFGMPKAARRAMTSDLSPAEFAARFANPAAAMTSNLEPEEPRARRRQPAARSRRGS